MMVPGWTDYAREWARFPFLLIAERMNIWTEVEGRLRIAALTGSDEDDLKCVARLLGALDVIRGHSPHRYRRLLADVRRILVFAGRRTHIRATYTERFTCA